MPSILNDYTIAFSTYQESLKIKEKINDKKGIASSLNNMANIFQSQDNYAQSLEYHEKSLKIREEIQDKAGIAASLTNIAAIYFGEDKLSLALTYFEKSLKMSQEIKNPTYISYNLYNIASIYSKQKEYVKAIEFYEASLKLREEIKDKLGISSCFFSLGSAYLNMGEKANAMILLEKSLALREEIKDKKGITQTLNSIALVYQEEKKHELAIEYALKSFLLAKEIKTPDRVRAAAETLFKSYKEIGNADKALEYFILAKQINDSLFTLEKTKKIANLGSTMELARKEKEFALLQRDKEIAEQAGKLSFLEAESRKKQVEILEKQAEADNLIALARLEKDKRKQDSLLNLAQKAQLEAKNLQIQKDIQEAEIAKQKLMQYIYLGTALTFLLFFVLIAIGFVQKQKTNRKLAEQNNEIKQQQDEIAKKNQSLNEANQELFQQQEELIVLTENLEGQKQSIEKSFKNLELLSAVGKEITASLDVKQIIRTVYFQVKTFMNVDGFGIGIYNEASQTLDFEGFIENDVELEFHQDNLDNDNLISAYCFNRQEDVFINNLFVEYANYIKQIGYVAGEQDVQSLIYLPLNNIDKKVGVITVQSFIKNAYNEQNITFLQNVANYTASALQKADSFGFIQQQKITLETTYDKLKQTTEQLDQSLQYASHVQSVVMPEKAELRTFFADVFILFRPRDVVSGDFYWFSQISKDTSIFCLADCTGHGVPGAFMSMLGSTLLHETVNVKHVHDDPAQILKNMHAGIRKILKQDKNKNNDGMDISICVFTKIQAEAKVALTFAGAKTRMSYVLGDDIFDIKGDKQYLGGEALKQNFTNHHLLLPEKTLFYLYTDGFQDQNNADRKKLGSKKFKDELLLSAKNDFPSQKIYLGKVLDEHSKGTEQRDDISVIGLRVL